LDYVPGSARGLMQKNDEVNYAITLEGRKAVAERDREDDAALRQVLEGSNKIANARTQTQLSVEQAAQCLAQAAKASSLAMDDDPLVALQRCGKEALRQALELLK